MSRYTFDTIIDRTQTESVKWDSDILAHLVGRGDSIPLWVADMDFQSPPEVIEALHARISHGIFGYPSPHALEKTRTSFCSWTERRHGWKIPQEQVVLSPGVISSIAYLILLSTQPGDRIVVQTPVYQPFYRIIESHGRAAVDNPLIYDELTHSYRMDLKDLEEKLSCPETTMMLFCSPHNPTGRVWTRRELEQVNELCDTYDVKIISDEIHADLTYPDHDHIPFSSLKQLRNQSPVTCMAPSKTFNIAGEHLSCAIIPDQDQRKAYAALLRRSSIENPGILAMAATQAAYDDGESWVHELIDYLQNNLTMMEHFFETHIPSLHIVRPEASFIAFIDCNALLPKIRGNYKTLASFFGIEAHVALHDGLWFGRDGRGFVRINFGTPASRLEKALVQIADAVDHL